jgi:hypothetical protein
VGVGIYENPEGYVPARKKKRSVAAEHTIH